MQEFKRGNFIEVKITDSAFGGKGIAKIPTEKGDYIVFVPNTIKGQTVSARIVKKKNKYAECKLSEVIHPSPDEIENNYQPISGAPYAKLPSPLQKENKLSQSLELYKRIGKVDHIDTLFDEYIESPKMWHYRNKMEYSFSAIGYDIDKKEEFDGFALGFKKYHFWYNFESSILKSADKSINFK